MDDLKKLLENAGMGEAVSDWSAEQQTNYQVSDDSGHTYEIIFQDNGGEEQMLVQANGNTVAWGNIGGAGMMDTKVRDPDAFMDAIFAFANESR